MPEVARAMTSEPISLKGTEVQAVVDLYMGIAMDLDPGPGTDLGWPSRQCLQVGHVQSRTRPSATRESCRGYADPQSA